MKSVEIDIRHLAKKLLPAVPLVYRDTVRLSQDRRLHRFDEIEEGGTDPDRLHVIVDAVGEIKAIAYPGSRWEKVLTESHLADHPECVLLKDLGNAVIPYEVHSQTLH